MNEFGNDKFKDYSLLAMFIFLALLFIIGGICCLVMKQESPMHIYVGWAQMALGGVSTLLSVLQYKQIRRKENETK